MSVLALVLYPAISLVKTATHHLSLHYRCQCFRFQEPVIAKVKPGDIGGNRCNIAWYKRGRKSTMQC